MFMKLLKIFSLKALKVLPLTRFFSLKRCLLRLADVSVSAGVRVVSTARFINTGKISLGHDSWIGHDVLFVGGRASITIGANVDIAPRVTFLTGSHQILKNDKKVAGPGYSEPIVIGDGCWICASATILPGTIVGDCCIIAAGAVVKGTFPSRCLIGGVPAKIIKRLD